MLKKLGRHPVIFSIIVFAVFLLGFLAVEVLVKEPAVWIKCGLDDLIPFWKYAMPAYLMWFPWIPVTLLYMLFKAPRRELWQLILPMYCGMLLCIIVYIVYPNGQQLRPAVIEGNDVFAWAVRALQGFDPPLNVCPSLHVLITTHLAMAWMRTKTGMVVRRPWIRVAACMLGLAIAAATVLLKQHSVIDVAWGFGMAVMLDILVGRTLVPKICEET